MEYVLYDVNVVGFEFRYYLFFGVLVVEEGYEDQFGWVYFFIVFGVQFFEFVNINVIDVRFVEGYIV